MQVETTRNMLCIDIDSAANITLIDCLLIHDF